MKLHYYKETDSLYIDLNSQPSVTSKEVASDVVVDFDASGKIVGIDIQNASKVMDLKTLETKDFPPNSGKVAG